MNEGRKARSVWNRADAERMIKDAWAPSMVITVTESGMAVVEQGGRTL